MDRGCVWSDFDALFCANEHAEQHVALQYVSWPFREIFLGVGYKLMLSIE